MKIEKPNRATHTFTHETHRRPRPRLLIVMQGDVFVANFTAVFYERFMKEWETQMNHYLETGEALKAA